MATRYCSLGDPRSWTELVTNFTSLGGINLDRDLESMLGWGTAPEELLPALVHEATHHWCFLSPVGFILAHLQLRARRRAALVVNNLGDTKSLLSQLLGDVIRYETATTMLRPLAEGLALFAEFDAVPGPTASIVSTPTTLVTVFFGHFQDTRGMFQLERWAGQPLEEWRDGESCARRKESVLGHPFNISDGGYLPGYLAVRNLWAETAQRYQDLLRESDLFLTFLRSFFYDDPGLVKLLLGDSPPSRDVAEEIIFYIAARFDKVTEMGKAQFDRLQQAISERSARPESDDSVNLIDITGSGVNAGTREAVAALLAETENPDQETVEGLLTLLDQRTLRQRDIIHLGSQELYVSVDSNGECTVAAGSKVVHVGPSLPHVVSGEAKGRLDLIFSILPERMARGSAIYRGDELVALSMRELPGDSEKPEASWRGLGDIQLDPKGLRAANEEMQEQLESVLAWEPIDKLVAEMRDFLSSSCEATYTALALRDIPDDRRSTVAATMQEDGLLPLLKWDRKIIYGLVLISISWSLRLKRPQIERKLAEYDVELEDILRTLNDVEREFRIPIVTDSGDLLFSSV